MHVDLDDGDERDVATSAVRLLPPDYPLVEGGDEDQIPLGELDAGSLTKHTVQVPQYFWRVPY